MGPEICESSTTQAVFNDSVPQFPHLKKWVNTNTNLWVIMKS